MKKIIAFFLILLGLIFVACGKESGIGEFIDKEKISSEYNIEKEMKILLSLKIKMKTVRYTESFLLKKCLK